MNIGDYYKHIASNMIGVVYYISNDGKEIDMRFEVEDLDEGVLNFTTSVSNVSLYTHYIKVSSLEKELL